MTMRVGVIGAGAIARRAHLPALMRVEGLELIGIADKVIERARNLGMRFGTRNAYSDHLELLEEGLDFVVLCTPSHLHGPMIVDCCCHGTHVLTEKPLAHNVEAALAAIKAAKNRNVKVCVVQNYRYYPALRQAKAIVDSGRLGNMLSIAAVAHTPPPMAWTRSRWLYRDGGALDDFGPHVYDIMAWFAASHPEVIFALGGDASQGMGLVNYAHVSVGFANGIHGAADLSWFSGSRIFSIDIYGTGGRLRIDMTSDSLEEVHGLSSPISDLRGSWGRALHTIKEATFGKLLMGGLAYYDQVYDDFVKYLADLGSSLVSLLDSIRAVQIMDYSRRSVQQREALTIPSVEEEAVGCVRSR